MERLRLKSSSSIGIINRGEAAVRFIRAVKEYNLLYGTNIETVAFYIDSEKDALFVQEADRAYAFSSFAGFSSLLSSPYMSVSFLVDVLKQNQCQGVWVGWGFVAEDANFARAVEQANLLLIGPQSEAMEKLGDKIKAKELANKTDVPTLPWSNGAISDLEHAQILAEQIGYPVILKSANGGGGRGIRKVYTPDELARQFKSVSDEIERFFGNRIVFMEALVVNGRHLEVQCMADYFGQVKTFGVRDCSVQRNNQKIVEETPPPSIDQDQMTQIEQGSARLLAAAGYHGAGTVEYLYDVDRKQPYFMEVNTRLQVEHPITEQLYDIDLVHMQIKVALGESLGQEKAQPRGHVIEVRLNAEDPDNKFSPTPGNIKRLNLPNLPGIRIDSGFVAGCEIPTEFDSMIAKIIASGSHRDQAIARLRRALNELQIEIDGGTTNQGFLLQILSTSSIAQGGVQTDFVEQYLKEYQRESHKDYWDIALISAVIHQYQQRYHDAFENFTEKVRRMSKPRHMPELSWSIPMEHEGHKYIFDVREVEENLYHLRANGSEVFPIIYTERSGAITLRTQTKKYAIQIVKRGNNLQVEVGGIPYLLSIDPGGRVSSPSPCVALTIEVSEGQKVNEGDLLLTLEAMKMEMAVTAPNSGVIKRVYVKAGEQLAAGQTMIDIESEKGVGDNEKTQITKEPIDFSKVIQQSLCKDLSKTWDIIASDYYAIIIGFDSKAITDTLQRLETFIEIHPEFRTHFNSLLIKSIQTFITIRKVFQNTHIDDEVRDTNAYECLMHFLLRKEDREKGLPINFLNHLEKAIDLYKWASFKGNIETTRALFHIYRAQAKQDESSELIRQSLLLLNQLYKKASDFTEPKYFSDLLGELIGVSKPNSILADAAMYIRFELIDKIEQHAAFLERQIQVASLLDSVLSAKNEKPQLLQDIIESGHQIVSYLVERFDPASPEAGFTLEVIGKRFNRDRTFLSSKIVQFDNNIFFELDCKKRTHIFKCIVAVFDEKQFFENLDSFQKALSEYNNQCLETIIIVRKNSEKNEIIFHNHMLQTALPVSLCSLGIYEKNNYIYRSYHHFDDHWIEDKRRRYMSPLRYREMRIERLANFDLDLVYHSRFVHVMKLEAKDNPKDQRLFAFVEVPETKFDLNESQLIERISAFEYAIFEAVNVIREQQARHKRTYHWNRIIAHIGHTHPLKLEQVGEYPKKIAQLVEGIGLQKMVIYTRIEGRQRRYIDAEVLVEKFSTNFNVRGRIPSKTALRPLDPYTSKVVKSLRMDAPYPYEVTAMLTSRAGEGFPPGKFYEYDIRFDASGQQELIDVSGRKPGTNISNVVFGRIVSVDHDGTKYERILILGDPSKDLGSLAEMECRRVMAAIDLAENEQLPLEWVPVSSGAAIGMETGTENLDWTARVLKRIVEFTQKGGEINIIVCAINVGAQSYWNAEATMLMHSRGLLIMTETGSMILTGKKALDFSGSVSADDNVGIGGVEQIMAPNGEAQFRVRDLAEAYRLLFRHYKLTYVSPTRPYGTLRHSSDPIDRDVCQYPYSDRLNQGFKSIDDIIGPKNSERKKPFDMRQVMHAVRDQDSDILERWHLMRDAGTTIIWQAQICGHAVGLIGIESKPLKRYGDIPNDGPDSWTGGTLYPISSKKLAKAINSFSTQMPLVILANLSGFDGSPESLRRLQLEYGAEIGRAIVNFKGPIVFIVVSRYHGGAYVVFSKSLNPNMRSAALEATYASVIGGAPAAAVVFPRLVSKNTFADPQLIEAQEKLKMGAISKSEYNEIYETILLEHQAKIAQKFEKIHTVNRAAKVGSIDDVIPASELRPYIKKCLDEGISKYRKDIHKDSNF